MLDPDLLCHLHDRSIAVTRLDDPRLEDYRALKESTLAAQRGAFIAESEVVLRVLVERSPYPVRSVLIEERRLPKLADVLVRLPAEVPLYVAPQALLDGVVGFHIHRGILAAAARPEPPSPEACLAAAPPRSRVLVLEALTNHDNVGGAFRNAAAFGADAVLLDPRCADPLYRKAIRVSVGGALLVPFARAASSEALVAALRAGGYTLVALTPHGGADDLRALAPRLGDTPRVAVAVGTEGSGLDDTLLRAADHRAKIVMAPGFDSLNTATAAAIGLFSLGA